MFKEVQHRRIQNPVKHLGLNIFRKKEKMVFTAANYFCKTIRLRYFTGFWIESAKLSGLRGFVGTWVSGVKDLSGSRRSINFWHGLAWVEMVPKFALGWNGSKILRKSDWNIVNGHAEKLWYLRKSKYVSVFTGHLIQIIWRDALSDKTINRYENLIVPKIF